MCRHSTLRPKRAFTILELALTLIIVSVLILSGFMGFEKYQRKLGQQRFSQNLVLYVKKGREVLTSVTQSDATGTTLTTDWLSYLQNNYAMSPFTGMLESRDGDLTLASSMTFSGNKPQQLVINLSQVTTDLCQKLAQDLININTAKQNGLQSARANSTIYDFAATNLPDVLSPCATGDNNTLQFNFAAQETQ